MILLKVFLFKKHSMWYKNNELIDILKGFKS